MTHFPPTFDTHELKFPPQRYSLIFAALLNLLFQTEIIPTLGASFHLCAIDKELSVRLGVLQKTVFV